MNTEMRKVWKNIVRRKQNRKSTKTHQKSIVCGKVVEKTNLDKRLG
jgi:hypothetical protein